MLDLQKHLNSGGIQMILNLLQNIDRVGQLAIHDAHLSPDLANVLLHLGGEGVEGISLVGEDGASDGLRFGRQVVIHLPARQLNQLRNLVKS